MPVAGNEQAQSDQGSHKVWPEENHADHGRVTRPARARLPGWPATLFGLFGAGLVWGLHATFAESLAAQACYKSRAAFTAPSWLMPMLGIATGFALVVACAGVAFAWKNWRIERDQYFTDTQHALDTAMGRRHFLAKAGLLLSILFLIGLVAAGFVVLLVSPCSAWR